jgi:hypothetical protein
MKNDHDGFTYDEATHQWVPAPQPQPEPAPAPISREE